MKLCLGFESHPYSAIYSQRSPLPAYKRRKRGPMARSQAVYGQGMTTQQVAKDLESGYSIVDKFYELEEDNIIEMIEEVFLEEIENVLTLGRPSRRGISTSETDKIERKFRQNLTQRVYDDMIPGVPTIAAQRGISHLRSHPYAKRSSRPSFIDTGMYMHSFKAWVEDID